MRVERVRRNLAEPVPPAPRPAGARPLPGGSVEAPRLEWRLLLFAVFVRVGVRWARLGRPRRLTPGRVRGERVNVLRTGASWSDVLRAGVPHAGAREIGALQAGVLQACVAGASIMRPGIPGTGLPLTRLRTARVPLARILRARIRPA